MHPEHSGHFTPAHGAAIPAPARQVRHRRWPWIVLGSVIVVLALVHFGGGWAAKQFINRKLAQMDVYQGHVEHVTLELWRGGVDVHGFVLRERDKPNEPPLVRVGHGTLSLAMKPLFRGKFGGDGMVEDVDILFVKHHVFEGPKDAAEKAAAEASEKKEQAQRWQDVLQRALPLELERFEMRNARIRYIDRAHQPNPDVEIRDVRVVVTGLQNRSERPNGELPTRVVMTGLTTGGGKLKLTVAADLAPDLPTFHAALELRALSLPQMNAFLHAYTGTDVSRGRFEMYAEIKAARGAYEGYIKPFFQDLDFKNLADENKNFAQRAKEKVVSAVTNLLKNEDEKVASVTPFSGTFQGSQVGVWETVHTLLRNAFIQALREGFGRG